MSPRHLAARQFWRDLIAAAERAGEAGLDYDDIVHLAMEAAIGICALDFSTEQLDAYLTGRRADALSGRMAVVKSALGEMVDASDFSDLRFRGGYHEGDLAFFRRVVEDLDRLRAFITVRSDLSPPPAT